MKSNQVSLSNFPSTDPPLTLLVGYKSAAALAVFRVEPNLIMSSLSPTTVAQVKWFVIFNKCPVNNFSLTQA